MSTKSLVDHASFLPRGLRRDDAAFYVGVSPATFDEMVKDGRMPQPKRVGKRTIWDRRQLDAYFEDLPDRNGGSDWDEAISKVKNENQT
jgi:predicted DNA-binding transcriptional regulator AlpA